MKRRFSWTARFVLALGLVSTANAADEELKPCAAADLAAARSFTPTPAQLKAYVDATVELQAAAKRDPTLAAALDDEKEALACRMDAQTSALGPVGAQALFGKLPQVAKVYGAHGVSARELGLWSFVMLPLVMSIDPQFGAYARQALSSQQVAFAKQNTAELQRFMKAVPRQQ
jgi:hypothetical protein